MHRSIISAVLLVFASACRPTYGGPHCEAITTSTPPESIPEFDPAELHTPRDTLFTYPNPFIAGTEEIACCASTVLFDSPRCTKEVDCDAYLKTLRTIGLDGKYKNESCGPRQGVALNCVLLIDAQNRIAGVHTLCLD